MSAEPVNDSEAKPLALSASANLIRATLIVNPVGDADDTLILARGGRGGGYRGGGYHHRAAERIEAQAIEVARFTEAAVHTFRRGVAVGVGAAAVAAPYYGYGGCDPNYQNCGYGGAGYYGGGAAVVRRGAVVRGGRGYVSHHHRGGGRGHVAHRGGGRRR